METALCVKLSPNRAPGSIAASDLPPSLVHLKRVVFGFQDRFVTEAVTGVMGALAPHAEWQVHASTLSLRSSLAERPADMIVSCLDLQDGDALDLLADLQRHPRCDRILVVTDRCESQVLQAIRSVGVRGALDTRCDGAQHFRDAFHRVACGETYWSKSFLQILHGNSMQAQVQRLLTPTELLLFAVLGDGCDDDTAATTLNLTVQGVHAYRKRLHRKLGVQHKGSLITLAIQTGLVRVTPNGIERPGFELLRSRCFFREKGAWRERVGGGWAGSRR